MKRKPVMVVFMVIAVLGLFFACAQPGDDDPIDYAQLGDDDPTPPNTYTVTYDGNDNTGGTVPTDGNTYEQDATVTVLDNTGSLLRIPVAGTGEAFKFGGWNTQADGNGTDYAASATFSMGTVNVTLYAKWVAFVLRDTGPAGGFIFYDTGSYSAWSFRYLEAAPLSTEWDSVVWSDPHASDLGTWTGIGEGRQNTIDIVSALSGESGRAAQLCDELPDVGGYSDWFLPSKEELAKMYTNLQSGTDENLVIYTPVGGFADDFYWSSSESDASSADGQRFSDGYQSWGFKSANHLRVRAVRAF